MSGDGNRIDQSRTDNRTVNIYYGLPPDQPSPNRSDRNEKNLLKEVHTYIKGRLLPNDKPICLHIEEQRNQVTFYGESPEPFNRNQDNEPSISSFSEVFNRQDVGGKLLLLGNSGAGKTTTMLNLANILVERAQDNPDELIPVIVNLSSWRNPKQSFADWLLKELEKKYGQSPTQFQTWLDDKKLLPLLDELDGLPPKRQELAVQEINTWMQSEKRPLKLLVCSRTEEYNIYPTNLALNMAVSLRSLTNDQIKDYLTSKQRGRLWEALQEDRELLASVCTPRLLSLFILACSNFTSERWQQLNSTQDKLNFLAEEYIQRALERPQKSRKENIEIQKLKKYLIFMAIQLEKKRSEEESKELLLEEVDHSWLTQKTDRILYLIVFSASFFSLFYTSLLIALTEFTGTSMSAFLKAGGLALGLCLSCKLSITPPRDVGSIRLSTNRLIVRPIPWLRINLAQILLILFFAFLFLNIFLFHKLNQSLLPVVVVISISFLSG